METKNFKIVSGKHPDRVESRINKLLDEGYILSGTLSTCMVLVGRSEIRTLYSQALIKKDKL